MVTITQAIHDLNNGELVSSDGEICTTSGELIILLEELQRYRNLKNQGVLVELPCKVGDIVYTVEFGAIQRHKVGRIIIATDGTWLYDNHYQVIGNASNAFYTESEAEHELLRLGGK